ncbi:4Fe-4S ferredoxin [Pseudodesulfovibrio cashew]|uniref:4Fe-4S ferredoxin n=1 Tax=Pseudodesulfovibrio cashew TaxID=2678688 RepID=A0A6I6JGE1_9BACT|nr:4Fe-4S binding protein [Pseudodesulfovibrio cashew]QGY41241.1 4Fe-4S ferredoxin [Pseudodesulfovibrio cashew]
MVTRKMISIDEELCNGCGQCVPACEEGALAIVDGKAKLVKEIYCDGLGACLGDCPTGALKVEVREAEDFNPEAVAEHLKAQGRTVPGHMPDPESLRLDKPAGGPRPMGGCPGSAMQALTPCGQANVPTATAPAGGSQLSHWPIQLRLVPPTAPFLKEADLLLTADCVAAAYPGYHAEFVPGRVVLMGCPKFDNQMEYVEKLAGIIGENDLKSITVLEMEVPCCSSMSVILGEAVKRAGKSVDTIRVTISRTGTILSSVPLEFQS